MCRPVCALGGEAEGQESAGLDSLFAQQAAALPPPRWQASAKPDRSTTFSEDTTSSRTNYLSTTTLYSPSESGTYTQTADHYGTGSTTASDSWSYSKPWGSPDVGSRTPSYYNFSIAPDPSFSMAPVPAGFFPGFGGAMDVPASGVGVAGPLFNLDVADGVFVLSPNSGGDWLNAATGGQAAGALSDIGMQGRAHIGDQLNGQFQRFEPPQPEPAGPAHPTAPADTSGGASGWDVVAQLAKGALNAFPVIGSVAGLFDKASEYGTLIDNVNQDENLSTTEKLYVIGGTIILDAIGVRSLNEAYVGSDAITARQLDTSERVIRGLTGAVQLGATIWGGASALSAGRSLLASSIRSAKPRVPWSYGETGGALGVTDKFGNITVRPGLVGRELTETVAHESVHRLLSPRASSLLGEFRANIGMAAYNRSHFVRYLEEAAAETWATGNLRQGIAFPFRGGYVTGRRVFIEGVGYVTIVGGTAYVGYHAIQENAP